MPAIQYTPMSAIVLIGLGPGDPELLTRAAARQLAQAHQVFALEPAHAALAEYPDLVVQALPPQPDAAVALLLSHAAGTTVYCALPGHPDDHDLGAALRAAPGRPPPDLVVVAGVSLHAAFLAALGAAGHSAGLQIVAARQLLAPSTALAAGAAAPAWSEAQGYGVYSAPLFAGVLSGMHPLLITVSPDIDAAERLQLAALIQARYPPDQPITLIQLAADGTPALQHVCTPAGVAASLADLAADVVRPTALFVPALPLNADRQSWQGLYWVVARLLGPAGCPWDHRQTHQSLRPALIEEAYEVLEALDAGDMDALCEELGDLLLSVLVHTEMARQAGHFRIEEVCAQLGTKLVRRHPHVFAVQTPSDETAIRQTWEQIKQQELAARGRTRTSALDGIPVALPALAAAQQLVKKAARVGFDWPDQASVRAKLAEEMDELAAVLATEPFDAQHAAEELGDALFAAVNLARWLDLDAETVLRAANQKFKRRFQHMEQAAHRRGLPLDQLDLAAWLALWTASKETT